MGMPHPGHDLGPVGLDFHPAAPSVALLPAPEFAVYMIQGNRDSGGQAGHCGHQALAMGLPGGLESQHFNEITWYQSRGRKGAMNQTRTSGV
jgi:hypothetical protein